MPPDRLAMRDGSHVLARAPAYNGRLTSSLSLAMRFSQMHSPKRLLAAAAVACLLSAPAALANCNPPQAPSKMPDGATASMQVMVTAMQTVKEYNQDVGNYLKCLDFELRQNQLTSDNQVSLHNAAVEQLQSITSRFNEQVRIFKSKHS